VLLAVGVVTLTWAPCSRCCWLCRSPAHWRCSSSRRQWPTASQYGSVSSSRAWRSCSRGGRRPL